MLGVSRQRVYQLAARPDFPEPVATLAQGKIWSIDDIEKWAAEHRWPRAAAVPERAGDLTPDLVGA